MNCDRVQAALSARMDGDHMSARHAEVVDAHVAGCARCRAFAERSELVRSSVRIRPAEPVPDLVDDIMASVSRRTARPTRVWALSSGRPPRRRTGPAVAAVVAGMIVGSLLVGGPWQRPSTRPIAAATVARNIRSVAPTLDAFQGTFVIREMGLAPEVPERTFEMEVAFLAPQRFRLDVRDLTAYPSDSWTPTDLTYIEDMPATFVSGPTGCPADLASGACPPTRATVSRVSEFSAAAPLPADLILPIATFGSARGIRVAGVEDLDGREAVRVELSFARAAPMFPFLRIGGTWRPFFDQDRVVLWLDAESWSPLRYTVFPSSDPERREWELRFGRPVESTDSPILDVSAGSVSHSLPDVSTFAIPGLASPPSPTLAAVPDRLGYLPATPTAPGELELVSVVLPTASAVAPRSLLVYAEGLDYLRVAERPGWHGLVPFGPVDPVAQEVTLRGGGVGYYEPAGEGLGRRLAIHSSDTDLYLETNLTRERLISIASSLPLRGRPLPRAWRVESSPGIEVERVGVDEALATVGLSSLPSSLPEGYVVASAQLESATGRTSGVTFYLRQRDLDAAGGPLTLHVEPRATLPTPSSADQVRVSLGRLSSRWTPGRVQLEWVQDGTYRSLQGEDLRVLLAIAGSLSVSELR